MGLASARNQQESPLGELLRRRPIAYEVFDQLAREILIGERAVGSALPPERELAQRFGVSRLVLRQAIHRLADMDLVRVRQGGATLVLEPDACDHPEIGENTDGLTIYFLHFPLSATSSYSPNVCFRPKADIERHAAASLTVVRRSEHTAGPCPRHLAAKEYRLACDKHMVDAFRVLVWMLKGSFVDDRCWVKDGNIGNRINLNPAVVHKSNTIGRQSCNFVNRSVER